MRSYIDRGYTVVKKKIGGASLDEDLRRIDSILSVLQDGQKLAVDANGRFDLDTAIPTPRRCRSTTCSGTRKPGDPLDFELQATLRNYYKNPMATGERPVLDAGRAQPDPLRRHARRPRLAAVRLRAVYGLVEYLRTLDMLREHGWSPAAASRTAATRCR
jgi:L-alanine-DL-glutamate epimerase-like enolase superfamily enzyme